MAKKANGKVTLEVVYDELKQLSIRVGIIEDAIGDRSVVRLPQISITRKEKEDIKRSLEEMQKEYYATLKEPETA